MPTHPPHGRRSTEARLAFARASLVCLVACACGASPSEPQAPDAPTVEVFASQAFYVERQEPEQVLTGVLRTRPVRTGPDTREHPFALVTPEREYGLYVSGFDAATLDAFVDREVAIRGKCIDLSAEGHGLELWAAEIAVGD